MRRPHVANPLEVAAVDLFDLYAGLEGAGDDLGVFPFCDYDLDEWGAGLEGGVNGAGALDQKLGMSPAALGAGERGEVLESLMGHGLKIGPLRGQPRVNGARIRARGAVGA